MDIKSMTPRELGMALMRGNKSEQRYGYSPMNALNSVMRVHELQHGEGIRLLAFLNGFARGLNHVENGERYNMHSKESTEGYKAGLAENAFDTHPFEVSVPNKNEWE